MSAVSFVTSNMLLVAIQRTTVSVHKDLSLPVASQGQTHSFIFIFIFVHFPRNMGIHHLVKGKSYSLLSAPLSGCFMKKKKKNRGVIEFVRWCRIPRGFCKDSSMMPSTINWTLRASTQTWSAETWQGPWWRVCGSVAHTINIIVTIQLGGWLGLTVLCDFHADHIFFSPKL